jgi:signal transduction histidine kinase
MKVATARPHLRDLVDFALALVDDDLTIRETNQAFRDCFPDAEGRAIAEVLGIPERRLKRRIAMGRILRQHITVDGGAEQRELEFTLEPRQGVVAVVGKDVERSRAGVGVETVRATFERLRKDREDALALAAQRERFLANMSHELRTPMNGVIGLAQALSHTSLDPTQTDYVSNILSSARALLVIINDILDLSKIRSGEFSLVSQRFDLGDLLKSRLRLLQGEADQNQVSLTLEYATDLTRWYLGDPDRLGQVVLNLVGNAIKFSPGGSVTVRVIAEPVGNRTTVRLEVEDTGIGIPAHRLTAIFAPFEQADSTTARDYGGTGLGLTISKKIVEAMGGMLTATSTVSVGSTFTAWLALAPADTAAVDESPPPPAEHPNSGRRVLLVDDNDVNRMVGRALLKRLGVEVVEATNGREAVARWREGGIDLILMDCYMPTLDGFEATREIRAAETSTRTPIVALTASVTGNARERCAAAGMDGYLAKPFLFEDLAAVVKPPTAP